MHISIDLSDATPIYEQLVGSIKELINRRELRPGDSLPTVRQLAQDLGVNLNTVARAYRELAGQGALSIRRGRGVSVIHDKPRSQIAERQELRKKVRRLVNQAVFLGIELPELHTMLETELLNLKGGGR